MHLIIPCPPQVTLRIQLAWMLDFQTPVFYLRASSTRASNLYLLNQLLLIILQFDEPVTLEFSHFNHAKNVFISRLSGLSILSRLCQQLLTFLTRDPPKILAHFLCPPSLHLLVVSEDCVSIVFNDTVFPLALSLGSECEVGGITSANTVIELQLVRWSTGRSKELRWVLSGSLSKALISTRNVGLTFVE